jgi:hypothetical protein
LTSEHKCGWDDDSKTQKEIEDIVDLSFQPRGVDDDFDGSLSVAHMLGVVGVVSTTKRDKRRRDEKV